MSKSFSQADVAAHKKPDDLWVIVDEDVYDLTKFQAEHPGGSIQRFSLKPEALLTCTRWAEKYGFQLTMCAGFAEADNFPSTSASRRQGCL